MYNYWFHVFQRSVPQASAPEDEENVQKQKISSHVPLDRSEPSLQGRQNLGNSAVCFF